MVIGIGLSAGAAEAGTLRFDCVGSAKAQGIDALCTLFGARLAAAFPGQAVVRSADPDVTLVIETAAQRAFAARVDWRGKPAGAAQGVARHDADLDDMARARLIDGLLGLSSN
ncbi:MAG: hypothetical protein MUC82_03425 [Cypionkella sp.]|nr:hypothetical protein [Cypionkella sp.]